MGMAHWLVVALALGPDPRRGRYLWVAVVYTRLLRVWQGHACSLGPNARVGGGRALPLQSQPHVRGRRLDPLGLGHHVPLEWSARLCALGHGRLLPAGRLRRGALAGPHAWRCLAALHSSCQALVLGHGRTRWALTIHSSRSRFAARLNSGVRHQ